VNSITIRPPVVTSALFPARLTHYAQVRAFLDAFCHAAGVPHTSCLRLNLVVEELFTNTVKHGHKGDSDSPVLIELKAKLREVVLTYQDQAPPFNPLAYAGKVATKEQVETGKVGGLGTVLTRELSLSADYTYLFGHNRIRLTLAR
jgi:anti-sigma regulatory factor (Ser/Thr protein kinase)